MQIFEAHFRNKFALAGMFGSSLVSIKTVGTLDSSSKSQIYSKSCYIKMSMILILSTCEKQPLADPYAVMRCVYFSNVLSDLASPK